MDVPPPIHCRLPAYRLFAAQLPRLQTVDGLLGAAVAISMHELDGVDPRHSVQRVDALARRVRNRVRSASETALVAHLHEVLFDEEGFAGNTDDYHNSHNSYVPWVLDTKLGIPISLALVYKTVAARAGLIAHGINAPGHFLARVKMDRAWTLVDVFAGGRIISRSEAIGQIERMLGRTLPADEQRARADTDELSRDPLFQAASHRDWIARMLRNLREIFDQAGRQGDVAAVQELFHLL